MKYFTDEEIDKFAEQLNRFGCMFDEMSCKKSAIEFMKGFEEVIENEKMKSFRDGIQQVNNLVGKVLEGVRR